MNENFWVVLQKIIVMFVLIAMGLLFRKRGYLDEQATQSVSLLLVDVIYPSLVFTQMLNTVNREALFELWYIPLLAMLLMFVALLVGWIFLPLLSKKEERHTLRFLVMVFNWVYLPLPIVEGLFGADGVKIVLLANVGFQVMLWSVGIWVLRGGKPELDDLKAILVNPGLIATLLGIAIAVLYGGANALSNHSLHKGSVLLGAFSIVVQAMAMLGSLTIPLSLLLTGVQLGSLKLNRLKISKELFAVILLRLIVAPVITVALFNIMASFNLTIPFVQKMSLYLISFMPVAISCSIITERYKRNTELAAQAIFYSTFISIITVPVAYYLIVRFGV